MPSTTDAPTRRVSTRHATPRGGEATTTAAAASTASPARHVHIPQHVKAEPPDSNIATPRSAKGNANVSTPGGSKTTLGKGVKQLPGGGGIFKSAAVAVLRLERKLMSTGDITRVALERGLINCQGKTPEATMASALYTDVKKKEGRSIFTRPQEGLFGLKEWAEEGFVPEPVMVDGGGGTPSEVNREAAAAATTPADGTPKSKRTRSMTLRQRTDMRKPWMVDDDDVDSRGTSVTDSPGARELSMTPKEKSGSDYAATELPGKQRLKNALRMQQQGQDSADSPFGDLHGRERGATGDSGGSRGQGGGSSGKKRPRLHVEVPGGGASDPHHGIQQLSGAQQAAMARALAAQQQQGGGRSSSQNNSDLLNFLDASRLIGSGAIVGMEPTGLTSFLPTSLESGPFSSFGTGGLRSPYDAAILGSLDTPALMNMPIPDGVPLTPEALAAAAIRSGLTPRWGLTPRMTANGTTIPRSFPNDDSPDAKRNNGSNKGASNSHHPQGGHSSYKAPQQQQQLFQAPSGGGGGSSAHPAMKSCAAAAEVAESTGGGLARTGSAIQGLVTEKWQPEDNAADKSRNDKGLNNMNNDNSGNGPSSQQRRGGENGRTQHQGGGSGGRGSGGRLSSLDELQRRIVALEVSLGPNHPQVGKAWLFLCRSAHLIGGREAAVRAEQALMRAREICSACSKTQTVSSSVDNSFSYLLERVRMLSTGF